MWTRTDDTGRIVCTTIYEKYADEEMQDLDIFPEDFDFGKQYDYRIVDGELVYDPLPDPPEVQLNNLKAQLASTNDLIVQAYEDMLDHLSLTEEFPRNTYVCMVEDVEELLEIDKNLPQDLGTYLEEYLGNHEEKKNRMLTLGDLIDEKENKTLVLYAPYLIPEETYVEWGGYYAIGAGMPPIDFE